MTVDQTFVLAGDDLYREAGHVALSRGAERNDVYAVGDADEDDELERHGRKAWPPRKTLEQVGPCSLSAGERG